MATLWTSRSHFLTRPQNIMALIDAILKKKMANAKSVRGSFPWAGKFIIDARTIKFVMHIENVNINIFYSWQKSQLYHRKWVNEQNGIFRDILSIK